MLGRKNTGPLVEYFYHLILVATPKLKQAMMSPVIHPSRLNYIDSVFVILDTENLVIYQEKLTLGSNVPYQVYHVNRRKFQGTPYVELEIENLPIEQLFFLLNQPYVIRAGLARSTNSLDELLSRHRQMVAQAIKKNGDGLNDIYNRILPRKIAERDLADSKYQAHRPERERVGTDARMSFRGTVVRPTEPSRRLQLNFFEAKSEVRFLEGTVVPFLQANLGALTAYKASRND